MMPRWSTLAPLLRTIGKALGVILFAAASLFAQIHNMYFTFFWIVPVLLVINSLFAWFHNRLRAATLRMVSVFMCIIPLYFDDSLMKHISRNTLYELTWIWLAILLITLGIAIRAVSADDRQRAAQKMPRAE